jgi:N-acetylmuramoyl-L-alanine amidase
MRKYSLCILLIFVIGCAGVPTKRISARYCPTSALIEVSELCQKHDMRYGFDTLDDVVRIFSSEKEMRLLLNSCVGYFDGGIIYLKRAPIYSEGKIFIPAEIEKIITSGLRVPFKPPFTIKTIVVDPGHGGKDPGAISPSGLREKEINLKVAKYLEAELRKRGFRVILTRSRDTFLTLEERVNVAKKYKADLFVSVHANSNRTKYVSGIEVYYLSPSRLNSKERSVKLAKIGSVWPRSMPFSAKAILWDMLLTKNYAISVEFSHALYSTFKNLGFKVKVPLKGPYYVLRSAYVPSVLVEIGYLSNKYEEKILRRKYYQKNIAESIALGIVSLNKTYTRLARKDAR